VTNDESILNTNIQIVLADKLKEFVGKWKVGRLSVVPRVALMEENYAIENSTITGMLLNIRENDIFFDDKAFYYVGVEEYDTNQLMSHFNLPYGQANMLCGGTIFGEEVETTDKCIKLFTLKATDSDVSIYLLIDNKNNIMLWVGETYEFIGFYELGRVE
jgi:hypothetical protein